MIEFKKILVLILLCIHVSGCVNNKKTIDENQGAFSQIELPSILKILSDNSHLPVQDRIALYHRLKKESNSPDLIKNEAELNLYGYSLLWAEKTKESIEIFKLVVAEFPDSWNAYDSLGEAYLAAGEKEKSLANYEKSLILNSENFYAKDNITLIKHPDTKFLTPEEKFDKTYSKEAYTKDLDQLGNKLISENINALLYITKENFWKLIEEKKKLINDKTTYAEFRWHCNEIVASINCSHTSMSDFNTENGMLPLSLRFPIQVRWIEEHLYVIDPKENSDKVEAKDEILSINQIPVKEIIDDIFRHIQSQAYSETPKVIAFNKWASGMIPFALQFPEQYEIELNNRTEAILLSQARKNDAPIIDSSIKKCEEQLCLEYKEEIRTGILSISSFVYYRKNNYQEFVDFIDQSMKDIQEKDIKHLIIDLRFNGGGAPEASIHLLRYLMTKPFTYYSKIEDKNGEAASVTADGESETIPFKHGYKGKTYFLIDGNGASTTGHFMSIAKTEKLGTIIGEELGSNQLCTAGGIACRLDSTRIDYYVANTSCVTYPEDLPLDKGILPDHYVTQSIDEYLSKVDVVKEYAIDLITRSF